MAKKPGRVGEADIGTAVLAIVDAQPGRQITTTRLIAELRDRIRLNAEDEEQLDGRNDDRFSQIVRNIKSHRNQPGNLIYEGHLISIPRGFRRP
ncbi:hypothetical protein RFM41_00010 [Mesorhizobium sp. VK25A]|uniref:Uncharacterized protein n=1 Tax=Mesorhizobium vachelliae TaxID=3072309 RepID=A0ABU4ZXJ6_9HYPH|nr:MULTISPECIES: hypothetical protein [unclassified Mesorhizobium]MDX8530117.1 hypothetical protein [Mesorhizobium sp. VK25D]MDX8542094.1 hypothetical protein [Mesorhizobium sp. VK25A]